MSKQDKFPIAGRPVMPEGYGIPENNDDLLPWSFVEENMIVARNYWVATVDQNGNPAATPVWGVWVEGQLYFDGSPKTRRGRNIANNPQVVVHLESGDRVVILEGKAYLYDSAPERSLAEKVAAAYRVKYSEDGYTPGPEQWDAGGLFTFKPEIVMSWTRFPKDVTRWKMA
jgi:nitroimidazol reductase NimA-like FMN-containing flavoprotein (pyridoxamine 5'-phosphate oxidase superfamily)